MQRECAQLCARHLRAKHFGKLLEEECGLGLLEEDCGLGLLERLWFRAWEEDCRALGAHTKLAASVCVCAYGMHAVCACTWKRESSKTSNHADCQRSAVTSLLARRRRPPRRRRRLRRRDVTLLKRYVTPFRVSVVVRRTTRTTTLTRKGFGGFAAEPPAAAPAPPAAVGLGAVGLGHSRGVFWRIRT